VSHVCTGSRRPKIASWDISPVVICDYPLAAKKMGLVQSHFSINEASMMDVKMIPELIVIGIGLIIIGMGAIMFYLGRYLSATADKKQDLR